MTEFTPLANVILDDLDLSPSARLLYAVLARTHDQAATKDGVFTISQQEVADRLGVGIRYAHTLMKELAAAGYVEVRRNGPKPATYRLHDGLRGEAA